MIINVNQKDSDLWELLDLDTKKYIRGVQWANDETGRYTVLVLDENGHPQFEKCSSCDDIHVIIKEKQGNVKLVKKGIGEKK